MVSHLPELDLCNILGNFCSKCGISDRRVLQLDLKKGGITSIYERHGNANHAWHYWLNHVEVAKRDLHVLCANCKRIKDFEIKTLNYNSMILT